LTERENLYNGLSNAAWGYFFLNFDFNLGTVSIFPRFVGFILFLLAIEKLSGERRDLLLLRPLGIFLAVWNAGDWVLSWFGGSIDGHVVFLDLLAAVARLYFEFQFLTDMAALAEAYRPAEDNDLDKRLRRRRTADVILVTALSLVTSQHTFPTENSWWMAVLVVLVLAGCIVSLMIMAGLFELRKFFLPDAAENDLG